MAGQSSAFVGKSTANIVVEVQLDIVDHGDKDVL